MVEKRFDESVFLKDTIAHTNFFNGRLLTAEAFQTEQKADESWLGLMGQALGPGIARGLEVTAKDVKISVKPGLGITRDGHLVRLTEEVELPLQVTEQDSGHACQGDFSNCYSTRTVSEANGLYLVTVAPVTGYAERAPMSGYASDGAVTGCGDKYIRHGVTFRLVPVKAADGDQMRNRVAHDFFGTEAMLKMAFQSKWRTGGRLANVHYGALEDGSGVVKEDVSDRELPLALIQWLNGKVTFVDMWAVRRRCQPWPDASDTLHAPLNGRRLAEAEAVWLQFQDHLDMLAAKDACRKFFRYMPPAGIVRPEVAKVLASEFKTVVGVPLSPLFFRLTLNQSFLLPPVDVDPKLEPVLILCGAIRAASRSKEANETKEVMKGHVEFTSDEEDLLFILLPPDFRERGLSHVFPFLRNG